MRRLGEILLSDFGWRAAAIDRALDCQRTEQPRPLIGKCLRDAARESGDMHAYEVALALLMQRSESVHYDSNTFPVVEYQELGRLLTFEQSELQRHVRLYWAAVIALYAYIAYPIYYVMQNPAAKDPAPLLRLYGLLGLGLSVFAFALGDDAVLAYGRYLNRRLRLARSRTLLRKVLLEPYKNVQTVMPIRGVLPHERTEPNLGGLQRCLPLCYAAWSSTKVVLMIVFLGIVITGKLPSQNYDMYLASVWIMVLTPIMVQMLAQSCERYNKYLREARAITPDTPYPYLMTEHLRTEGSHRYRVVWRLGYGLISMAIVACALWATHDKTQAGVALVVAVIAATSFFALRFAEYLFRMDHMRLAMPADAPLLGRKSTAASTATSDSGNSEGAHQA